MSPMNFPEVDVRFSSCDTVVGELSRSRCGEAVSDLSCWREASCQNGTAARTDSGFHQPSRNDVEVVENHDLEPHQRDVARAASLLLRRSGKHLFQRGKKAVPLNKVVDAPEHVIDGGNVFHQVFAVVESMFRVVFTGGHGINPFFWEIQEPDFF